MNKKVKLALIIFGIIVFVWYSYVGVMKYINWRWYEGIKKEAVKFEADLTDREAKIANDTYGGKTPQETLALFITAVEEGDYELASKYFVVEKQGEELKSLRESERKNIDNIISLLKEAKNWRSSLRDEIFVMKVELDQSPSLFINFTRYPSNLWKIDEI